MPVTPRPLLKRPRVIVGVVLAVLAIIVVLQNTGEVSTKILFFSVAMPHAVLLFVTLLVGFILGMVVATRLDLDATPSPPLATTPTKPVPPKKT